MLYKSKGLVEYKNIFMGFIRYSYGIYLENVKQGKNVYNALKTKILRDLIQAVNRKKNIILRRNKNYLEILKRKLNQYRTISSVQIKDLRLTTASRLIIDVSSPLGWAIDEIGLAWDKFLDTPYLPATAIKGIFRAKLESEILERLINQTKVQKSNELLETAKLYANYIVGGKTDKGREESSESISLVSFYNAYPIEAKEELVTADVITPIYTEYIEEHKVAPKPIFFLAIAPNVTFEFIITIRKREIPDKVKRILNITTTGEFEEEIISILKESLIEWGIGAKTSSGYGVFRREL